LLGETEMISEPQDLSLFDTVSHNTSGFRATDKAVDATMTDFS